MVRYRYAQRAVAERVGNEIELIRASLADKASRAQTEEQLEHIRGWQLRVDEEASTFRGAADRFRGLLETDLPRTEAQLMSAIASLEAARGLAT